MIEDRRFSNSSPIENPSKFEAEFKFDSIQDCVRSENGSTLKRSSSFAIASIMVLPGDWNRSGDCSAVQATRLILRCLDYMNDNCDTSTGPSFLLVSDAPDADGFIVRDFGVPYHEI